jgi:hypothetical protein
MSNKAIKRNTKIRSLSRQFKRVGIDKFVSEVITNLQVGQYQVKFDDKMSVEYANENSLPSGYTATIYPLIENIKPIPLIVFTSLELDDWSQEQISGSLWCTRPDLVLNYMDMELEPRYLEKVQKHCGELCNNLILAAVTDIRGLVYQYIRNYGYGELLGDPNLEEYKYNVRSADVAEDDLYADLTVSVFFSPTT